MSSFYRGTEDVDPAKTHIDWTLGDILHTVQGTFQLESGSIVFDPHTGEAGGQIIVDAASGNSGNGTRDSKMKKEVLETTRYPDIVGGLVPVGAVLMKERSAPWPVPQC